LKKYEQKNKTSQVHRTLGKIEHIKNCRFKKKVCIVIDNARVVVNHFSSCSPRRMKTKETTALTTLTKTQRNLARYIVKYIYPGEG
jgi:hypothetical protein